MSIHDLLHSAAPKLANTNAKMGMNVASDGSHNPVTEGDIKAGGFSNILDSLLAGKNQEAINELPTDLLTTKSVDENAVKNLEGIGLSLNKSEKLTSGPLAIGINQENLEKSEVGTSIDNNKLVHASLSAKLVGTKPKQDILNIKGEAVDTKENLLNSLKINSTQAKRNVQNVLNVEQKISSSAETQNIKDGTALMNESFSSDLLKKQAMLKQTGGKNSYKNSDMFSNNLVKLNHAKVAPTSIVAASTGINNKNSEIVSSAILGEVKNGAEQVGQDTQQFAHITKSDGNINSQTVMGKNVITLTGMENSSSQELINKISTYIEQNSFMKNDQLQLTVHHKELGKFDVSVQQNQQTQSLDILINSASKEGVQFFNAHEKQLMVKLSQAGIELNDFKVVSRVGQLDSARSSSESMFSNSDSHQGRGSNTSGQGNSQQNSDSERRRSLWEEYRERYYA